MTHLEAIEELKYDCAQLGKSVPCDTSWGQAINTAYGMAISTLEKQIPKKPIPYMQYSGKCVCGVVFLDRSTNYCGNCGQRLDWRK